MIAERAPDRTRLLDGSLVLRAETVVSLVPLIEESARTPSVKAVSLSAPVFGSSRDVNWLHQSDVPNIAEPWDYETSRPFFQNGVTGEGEIIAISDSNRYDTAHCLLRYDFAVGSVPPVLVTNPPTDPLPTWAPTPGSKVIAEYENGSFCCNDSEHGQFMAYVASADQAGDCLARDDDPWAPGDCGLPQGVEHESNLEGVAPGARLVLQESELVLWPATEHLIHAQAYDSVADPADPSSEGARVYQSSRNEETLGRYSFMEAPIDLESWRRRDYSIVVSSGNSGTKLQSLNHPAFLKGGMSLGLTWDQRPWGSSVGPDIWVDPQPTQGSARGPASHFRVKPDFAAGTVLFAAMQWHACTPHSALGGTSSAAAASSGLAAMVRQYLRHHYPSGSSCSDALTFNPTNALIKATLINSTRNVPGIWSADNFVPEHQDRPTFGQGWGFPVLGDSLFFPGDPSTPSELERTYSLILTDTPNGMPPGAALSDDRAALVVDQKPAIQQGEVHEFVIRARAGEDLHVTLTWTDPPASPPTEFPLLSDLDLEVVGPNPSNAAQQVVWRPNPGVTSDVDASGANRDIARAWTGGYTRLGTAVCGDPPPPNVFSYDQPNYETCVPAPTCPAGQPQYLFEQAAAPPFACFNHRDPFNTVENVFIKGSDVRDADYRVRVIGFDVTNPGLTGTMLPDYNVGDGIPGGDAIDGARQGYALVVSGDVSADRGFVHMDRAHYVPCDDVQVTVVDRNLAAGATVEVRSAGGDVETVVSNAAGRFPVLPSRAPDPTVIVGDGVLQFAAGDALTARYDDAAPVHASTACASTGPLLTVASGLREMCGDGDGLVDPGETAWLDVTITNVSIRTIAGAVGLIEMSSVVEPIMDRALFDPGLMKPLDSATATFGIAIDPAAPCPVSGTVALSVFIDGRLCFSGKPSITTGDCSGPATLPAVPDEVPDTSVRVVRQGTAGVELTWLPPATGADAFNVYRGEISSVFGRGGYDHHEDATEPAGLCATPTARAFFTDAGSGNDNWYYLVTAVNACPNDPSSLSLEGTAGFASAVGLALPVERPTGWGCP